ncbi:MAG: glycosyltransferase [Clostridiaceae bacterium]
MPLISVVIPVYNLEKYLSTSIESVLNQTFKDFEIIIINDGSSDKSGVLCDRYAEQDNRIKVLHIKNNGVSNARNIGLKYSSGKYVFFCDGDDYIDNHAFEIMVKMSEEYKIDLLICGYYFESHQTGGNNKIHIDSYPVFWNSDIFYPSRESIKKDLVSLWNKSLMYNVWNKFYRLDIIQEHDIRFSTELAMGEDLDFTNKYFMYCNSFYILNNCFYHYIREREDSATTRYVEGWFEIRVEEHKRLLSFFENYGITTLEAKEFLSRRFIERVVGCIENELNNKNTANRSKKRKNIKEMINHLYTRESLRDAKLTSKKMKVILLPIRIKNVSLTYAVGILISFVRKRMPHIFIRLKQRR